MKIICDILLAADEEHQICHCHVDLGAAVVLNRVQFFVMSVAVSDLNGNPPESPVLEGFCHIQSLQLLH